MKDVQLTRKLVLEDAQRIADGAGGFSESWVSLGTLWADVQARTGRERDAGDLSVASVGYRITVRGAPEGAPSRPRPDQRLREGNRVFVIQAVAERDPQGRYLTCFAREEIVA